MAFTKRFRALGTSTSCYQPFFRCTLFLLVKDSGQELDPSLWKIITKSLQEVRVLSSFKKHLGHYLRSSKFYMEYMASFRLRSQMIFQTETIKCMGEIIFGGSPRSMRHHLHPCLSNHKAGCMSTTGWKPHTCTILLELPSKRKRERGGRKVLKFISVCYDVFSVWLHL